MKTGTTYFKIALINGIPKIVENNKLHRRLIIDNAPIFLSLNAACAWIKNNYSANDALKALENE